MRSFEEAIADLVDEITVPDGEYVSRLVSMEPSEWPSGANAGRPAVRTTWRTDEGHTIHLRIGDFNEWASGKPNYMLFDFLRAVGCDREDDIPPIETISQVEAVLRVESRNGYTNVKSIRPFGDDITSVEHVWA